MRAEWDRLANDLSLSSFHGLKAKMETARRL